MQNGISMQEIFQPLRVCADAGVHQRNDGALPARLHAANFEPTTGKEEAMRCFCELVRVLFMFLL
jgi:hypothetical protein